jgi:nucleotide-binding universal stress UspA family protein
MTQKLFEKVLVATDGSERNRAAVSEALRIGRESGSAVYAVYVIDTGIFETASGGTTSADTWAFMQSEAATALAQVKSKASGVNIETVILEGKPATNCEVPTEKNMVSSSSARRGKRVSSGSC